MARSGTDKKVVIYGGGVGGAQLAKRLTGAVRVTLVDPLDYFEVPMAAPRNLVMPDYAERAIMPFAQALPDVKHVRARLIELRPDGGLVEAANGQQTLVSGDITVLATGSRFTNPLVRAFDDSATERKAFYARIHRRLADAQRVLIVGGGPIGVEIAGEISETWPDKAITIVEAGPRILAGTSADAAAHAATVLAGRGTIIITGDRLNGQGHQADDILAPGGVAQTHAGRQIPYDLLLWCVGGRPNTSYMKTYFSTTLNDDNRIRVTPELRVVEHDALFALGDITDLAENKMAWLVNRQVKIAEANVRALLTGAKMKTYVAQTGNPMMAITLGSRAGVARLPRPVGVVRADWFNRNVKASHMLVPKYRKVFGV
jgi:NADH dehydrogenase FAD-containing subunit